MHRPDVVPLVWSIVDVERAIVSTRDADARRRLRETSTRLRRLLGPTIPKTKAAMCLGVSVTALDGWVDAGYLPVVARPGSTRLELEARLLLEVATARERLRGRVGRDRVPVIEAIRDLGLRSSRDGRRVVPFDVAVLPRPNTPVDELATNFEASTPIERVREVALLSATLGAMHG